MNIYNFIDIEAIQDIEHIIPCFNLDNEYFVGTRTMDSYF